MPATRRASPATEAGVTPQPPVGAVLKRAILAGLVAGLIVAAFHFVVTEPVIDQAIGLEEQLRPAGEAHEEPPVSRDAQRGGLVVGFVLYGLTWSALLGAIYSIGHRWLPQASAAGRAAFLSALAYWALALFPFIKYPANPPGVGDPETIGYRQMLYVAALLLGVAGAAGGIALLRALVARARGGPLPWVASLAFLAAYFALLYLVLPANPDEVRMPPEVVSSFRALSVAGLSLFWGALALVFGLLLRRAPVARPRP